MLTLAFECSALNLLVGIIRDNKLIQQSEINDGFSHSEMLIVKIEEILKNQQIWYQDLDLVVVSNGPSSFTATRVALSVAKMINISCQKPVVTVNKCELLAFFYKNNLLSSKNNNNNLKLTVIVNACGNEVFFARYCYEDMRLKCLSEPDVSTIDDLIKQLNFSQDLIIFDQQLSYDHFINKISNQALILQNDVLSLGLLGLEKYHNLLKNNASNQLNISPIYLLEPRISKRK